MSSSLGGREASSCAISGDLARMGHPCPCPLGDCQRRPNGVSGSSPRPGSSEVLSHLHHQVSEAVRGAIMKTPVPPTQRGTITIGLAPSQTPPTPNSKEKPHLPWVSTKAKWETSASTPTWQWGGGPCFFPCQSSVRGSQRQRRFNKIRASQQNAPNVLDSI